MESNAMHIEKQFGNNVVLKHIFPPDEIVVGSQWQSSVGAIVTVDGIDRTKAGDVWIKYHWMEQGHRRGDEKINFVFQCRYNLIVD
jgi:hypothetical protein